MIHLGVLEQNFLKRNASLMCEIAGPKLADIHINLCDEASSFWFMFKSFPSKEVTLPTMVYSTP